MSKNRDRTTLSMSTSAPAPLSATAQAQVRRARELLVAGLVGSHAVGLVCIGLFGALRGPQAMGSAAVGFALVVLFSTLGQLVMIRVAVSRPRVVLFAAMASYVVRCALLTLALGWVFTRPELMIMADRLALVVSTVATVIGWLTAEVVRFARMRIPVFEVDLPEESAA